MNMTLLQINCFQVTAVNAVSILHKATNDARIYTAMSIGIRSQIIAHST